MQYESLENPHWAFYVDMCILKFGNTLCIYIWGNGTKDFTLTEFWFVDPKTRTKRALSLLFTVCKNQLNPKLTESRTFYFLLKLSYITWYYIKKERSFGFRLWYLELLSNRSGLFVFQPWKFYFVFCYNWKKSSGYKFWRPLGYLDSPVSQSKMQ